jgi:phosphomannomutase
MHHSRTMKKFLVCRWIVTKYIFDVDGTLTPSRGQIDLEFKAWFNIFCKTHDVYLVTGSDREKTVEQIGEDTYDLCKRVYNCSGSDVYEGANNVRTTNWEPPLQLIIILGGWLQSSKFQIRTGRHIEHRPGMVNFSIVGRNCTAKERSEYVEYDKASRERETIAYIINSTFDDITATVGGETGLDIHPTGSDKSQVLTDFGYHDKIVFYGDSMFDGGNDLSLAKALTNGSYPKGAAVPVKDWEDTFTKLLISESIKNEEYE